MDINQVKKEMEQLAESHREEFEAASAHIFAHPELAYHETLAQDQPWISGAAEGRFFGNGFCGRVRQQKAGKNFCFYGGV